EHKKEEKTEFVRDAASTKAQIEIKPTPKPKEFVKASEIEWSKKTGEKPKSEYALNTSSEYFVKKQEEIVEAFKGIEEVKEQKVAETTGENIKIDILTKMEEANSTTGTLGSSAWGFDTEDIRVVGQVFDTYIIAEADGIMIIADQHAAHERLKYEELKKELEKREVTSQMLLVPVVIDVTAGEMAAFNENKKNFADMGFELEEFGSNALLLRATPETLSEDGLRSLVVELINQFSENRQEIISEKMQRALYTIACKAAVKANHKFDNKQLETLLKEIFALENINTCPHGRPIVVTMSQKELEKEFKRIV
ncbi:MAG: hypothetical protein IKR46_03390, partial [Clostridia bacterium]|nr:hypothetical protein [Clostridia bacterium]